MRNPNYSTRYAGNNNPQPAVPPPAAPGSFPQQSPAGYPPPPAQRNPQQAYPAQFQNAPPSRPPEPIPFPQKPHNPVPQGQVGYISQKCAKVNGNNKVIDFNGFLTQAKMEDFAMVHGCGGKGHARNSTIGITICDYTRGKNENSVTVKYNIDVEDCTVLYQAAIYARLGLLPVYNPQNPAFSYSKEKVNPYDVTDGYAPCSKITINFAPFRQDGQVSKYPWYVAIENFKAPIQTKQNGSTNYKGAQAIDKTSAFINLSADDFAACMVAVDRFVRLWEHRMLPVMDEAYRRMEWQQQQRQAK